VVTHTIVTLHCTASGQLVPQLNWQQLLLQTFGCLPDDSEQAAAQRRFLTCKEPHWQLDQSYFWDRRTNHG